MQLRSSEEAAHHTKWTERNICFLFVPSAIECPQLYAPNHGSKLGSQVTYNSQVYFSCDRGYKLRGNEVRRCQNNKTWSGQETTCQGLRSFRNHCHKFLVMKLRIPPEYLRHCSSQARREDGEDVLTFRGGRRTQRIK